ncbi:MAG: hypothetical protein E6J15_01660 [Chloroflexi bacterium]|nr:MAG: hypothetical protein E6J15_01660 [Chloroflexota bacterium]
MKPRFVAYLAALALVVSLIAASAASPATSASGVTRQIALAGTGSFTTGAAPSDASTGPEFPAMESESETPDFNGVIPGSVVRGGGSGVAATTAKRAKSNPEVNTSFEGLNLFQHRFARSGNQFTLEPPDQGLCVGNGYVVEPVNTVVNVFNSAGVSVLPDNTSTNIVAGFPTDVNHAVDLNSFYGYAPAINRSTGVRAQFIADPSCLYDAATQRFFLVVLTLETRPNGSFTLQNHIDIAVSQTSNPTGTWNIYRVDVTNDGSNPTQPCPCLGDYPHIGADANGFYVTTNSYPWTAQISEFAGAQVYAFPKAQLAAGAASVRMVHFDTFGSVNVPSDAGSTQPGFTLWPAQSPGTSFDANAGGTEYFLSSNAADEATHPIAGIGGNYTSSQIVAWSLTNTSSLNTASPTLTLSNKVLAVSQYAIPPKSKQPGSGTLPDTQTPQGYCINDTKTKTIAGTGCWRLIFATPPKHDEKISRPDSNDTRMQQVMYANGKIWGALDTAVTVGGENRAGVAWYVVKPDVSTGSISASIVIQGIFGVESSDLSYPAIGVTQSGRGVIALTLSGDNDYPSAAYAAIDAIAGVGDVHVVAAGAATDDGFTSYKSQVGNPPRTRWGDYGAAAVDGNSIWIASEYIAHACDYATWGGRFFGASTGDNKLGTCAPSPGAAGTRTAFGNWSTRISKLTP